MEKHIRILKPLRFSLLGALLLGICISPVPTATARATSSLVVGQPNTDQSTDDAASSAFQVSDVIDLGRPTSVAAVTSVAVPSAFQVSNGTVAADGVIEPLRWSELSFSIGGDVAEVLIAPGDRVAAGAPLVRLDTAALQLSLQSAQQEVVAQEASLTETARDYAQRAAEAEIALKIAQLELEESRTRGAGSAPDAARYAVQQLEQQLTQARAVSRSPDVTAAQVALTRAQAARDAAQAQYDSTNDPARAWEPNIENARAAAAYELQQAEYNVQLAQAALDDALETRNADAVGSSILQTQIEEAQVDLKDALNVQAAYTVTLEILTAEVEASQLRLDNLRALEAIYRDWGSDTTILEAEARLEQARLAVAQLELQLHKAELRAPYDGTVVQVQVQPGERIEDGEVVLMLATLDELEARTTNLSELDVAQVAVGQQAVITVEALPERQFSGTVREIALQSETVDDKVTFTVKIALTDSEPVDGLRWGMTAFVEIETE